MASFNSFWKRHRRFLTILVLFAVPLAPLLLLRVQWPRWRLYDHLQAAVVHPTAEMFGNLSGGVHLLWSRYLALVHAKEENEKLRVEMASLERRLLEIEEMGRENERLKKILEMPELARHEGIAAKIIGQESGQDSLSFVINVGSQQGLKVRMPVVHAEGIVGTLTQVYRNSAVFMSFLDPNHDLDGRVVRSRARLVVEGKGRNLLARLKYLDRADDARVGDEVITGGLDGVFPEGWPVGTIVKIDKPNSGVTQEAELRASVDPGKLEEVIVLRSPQQKADSPASVATLTQPSRRSHAP